MTYEPSDPYVWFDPFEMREAAARYANQVVTAREDGARAITQQMARDVHFEEKLILAVQQVADQIARKYMFGEMKNRYADYKTVQRRAEQMRDEMYHSIGLPATIATIKKGKFDIAPEFSREQGPRLEISFYTLGPVSYSYRLSLR